MTTFNNPTCYVLLFLRLLQWLPISNAQGANCVKPSREFAPGVPGFGVEFECTEWTLNSPGCSGDMTWKCKGQPLLNGIDRTARSDTTWELTGDTTYGVPGRLTAEYILLGTKIKLNENMAAPAAAAVSEDIVNTFPHPYRGVFGCIVQLNLLIVNPTAKMEPDK
jgi:hypothetical protein